MMLPLLILQLANCSSSKFRFSLVLLHISLRASSSLAYKFIALSKSSINLNFIGIVIIVSTFVSAPLVPVVVVSLFVPLFAMAVSFVDQFVEVSVVSFRFDEFDVFDGPLVEGGLVTAPGGNVVVSRGLVVIGE